MILFYAIGGGLGHLSRCQAFLHTMGWEHRDCRIITASPRAAEVFDRSRIIAPPETADPKVLRRFVDDLLHLESFDEIYLDAFPAGILGELVDWQGPELNLIARHIKWEAYQKRIRGSLPQLGQVFACEDISREQIAAMKFREITNLNLKWPDLPGGIKLGLNCWLIVHAGPEEEVAALYGYAKQVAQMRKLTPQFCIVGNPELNPDSFPEAVVRSTYPAWPLFEQAAMVITAGGFNSVAQMSSLREKHICLPFYRPLDDQGYRKALRDKMLD
jgi:hypothetical protein